jgi:hypothetical protein
VSRKPSPEERNVIAIETFRKTATGNDKRSEKQKALRKEGLF